MISWAKPFHKEQALLFNSFDGGDNRVIGSSGRLVIGSPPARVHTEWTLMKDGHTRTASFEHNLYSGRELKDRLLGNGFSHVQLFGSPAGAPYDLNALRLIAVARK